MNNKEIKQLKEDMLDTVLAAGYLTIPQLQRLMFKEGHQTVGDYTFRAEDLNVILWGGLSEGFLTAVSELSGEKMIRFHSAPKEIYWMEGVSPSHPTVSDLPKTPVQGDVLYPVLIAATEEAAAEQKSRFEKKIKTA